MFLTAPVTRSATIADLLSPPMIRPLVLSRQPCSTAGAGHALGNGFGGSGGAGGGGELGAPPRSGSMVNGSDAADNYNNDRWRMRYRLRFGMVAVTEMACAPMQMATERNFLRVLERTRYAHFDQESLVLLDAQQSQIAQFNSTLPTPE